MINKEGIVILFIMKKIWTKDTLLLEALKYKTRKQFAIGSSGAYDAALNLKIIDDICKHMIILRKKWSLEKLHAEALKYSSRNQFRFYSTAAYIFAFHNGMLDLVCSHMPKDLKIGGIPHNKKWTIERISMEALKYNTRSTFKKGNEGAYDAAKTMKILDIVCKHMKISRNSSTYENDLFKTIKLIYPNAIKIRDRNVSISDKPYIKGFDIDVFVPELNKGIEMDGEYWHSFEVMWTQKSKLGWSKEDVLNYKSIKDDYFLSKGIKVLHVSDREWLDNKEQSLIKILSFLKELT